MTCISSLVIPGLAVLTSRRARGDVSSERMRKRPFSRQTAGVRRRLMMASLRPDRPIPRRRHQASSSWVRDVNVDPVLVGSARVEEAAELIAARRQALDGFDRCDGVDSAAEVAIRLRGRVRWLRSRRTRRLVRRPQAHFPRSRPCPR